MSTYKVGDELAFRCGWSGYWQIDQIQKITPSGRLKCGRFELNPDLSIRGNTGNYGPYRGEPVTDAIKAEIEAANNLRAVRNVTWKDLTDSQLARVVAIISESTE